MDVKEYNGMSYDEEEWWRHDVIYHIYPRSFSDSNGDGVGDLNGIRSKLDYIVSLGLKTIYLSPIYKSPMKDFGYDIQDFRDIDDIFGTLEDFKNLVKEMKEKGLRLVMDFVPNHTSDQHEWFQKSLKREDPYTDYYVWFTPKYYDGDRPLAPNNWRSVFGGSMWEWSEERKQFYLHQFAKEQPDLNFHNPAVIREMADILVYWMDLGVDGFRVDAVGHIFEDLELRDEPPSWRHTFFEYETLQHVHTFNLPEVLNVMRDIRKVLDEYTERTDQIRRLFTVEVYTSVEKQAEYYGSMDDPLSDFPFNFVLLTHLRDGPLTAEAIRGVIQLWMDNTPEGKWPNWVMGNHDNARVATRFGEALVDGFNMILLLLPGTAVTYYGEEIGMENATVSWEQTIDVLAKCMGPDHYLEQSRDPVRTPMQWTAGKNAGFSDAESTWLPIAQNYERLNVEAQQNGESHLNVYRALMKARSSPAVKRGRFEMRVVDGPVFSFIRSEHGSLSYLVAVNVGDTPVTVDLRVFHDVPEEAEIYVHSVGYAQKANSKVNTSSVFLGAKDGLVLTYKPK